MRLLIVEDEKKLCDTVAKSLYDAGYEVDTCYDGEEALDYILAENYDLIVLDLNLPGMDGLSLLKQLKQEKPESKVLILSANHHLETKLSGFTLGASDYLTKPFHFAELEARIRVLLNRQFIQQSNVLRLGDLALDTLNRTASVGEEKINFTAKELAILEYFMMHPGKLITQQELIDHVWNGDADPMSNSIRVHLSAMRKKLKAALGKDPIQTKIGEGYLLP